MTIKSIRLATRRSKLALWQTNFVANKLLSHFPDLKIEIVSFTTEGDKILDRALNKIGGKGLFIKELEQAMIDNNADLAIHSLKDMPAILDHKFTIAAVLERHNPWDAILGKYKLLDLPDQAIVGTSSLRRAAQLLYLKPNVIIKPLRGNIDTRIQKLQQGEFDAIILAAAGLERLGLSNLITEIIDPGIMLPACSQGAIAIECLTLNSELIKFLQPLNHQKTYLEVMAERDLNAELGGSCESAIAIHANIIKNQLKIEARIMEPDGSKITKIHRGQILKLAFD